MDCLKFKNRIYKLLLPLISYISKLKYQQGLKAIPTSDELKTALHCIIERWNDTALFSLESFFQTDFGKNNITIFLYCFENDSVTVLNTFQTFNKKNIPFEIIFTTNNNHLFEQALKNAVSLKSFDMHGFCHAEAVYNKEWYERSIGLGLKLTHTNTSKKIAAFSAFNPNDFKLFDTIYKDEDYLIKNGFSFLTVFFYNIFLQKFAAEFLSDSSGKHLTEILRDYDFFTAFTNESYVEGINNVSEIEAEKFYPKPNNLSFAQNPCLINWQIAPEKAISFPFLKLRTLIIQINYGGLGDHLFCSHLPRIAKETGRYDKVYISNYSKCRQEAFKELFWVTNPFIDGFCDIPGYNIEFLKFNESMNILDKIMLLHNMDDGKRFHEPELYYKPVLKSALSDKIIFDPNYVSDAGDKIPKQSVEKYFRENNINVDYQMQERDKSLSVVNFSNWLQSESLEDFINIIASCKEIYCFASGTATLAAALGKKAHVFYHKDFSRQFLHSKISTYIKL